MLITGKIDAGKNIKTVYVKTSMTDEQAYEALCISCWRECQCHEDMEFCDKYLQATEEG